MTSVVHIQQWEWLILGFKARQYVEEYSLVNFHWVSLHEAYETSVWGVEQIFDIYTICLNLEIMLSSVLKLPACLNLCNLTLLIYAI